MTSPAPSSAKQPKRPREGLLPFWLHQSVEYGIALLGAMFGARMPHPVLPVVAAVVLLLVAATADGPLAAAHLVGRTKHRWVDLVYGVAALVAAGALYSKAGSGAALLTGGIGVAVLALSWRSSYALKPVKPPRRPLLRRSLAAWRAARPKPAPDPTASVTPNTASPMLSARSPSNVPPPTSTVIGPQQTDPSWPSPAPDAATSVQGPGKPASSNSLQPTGRGARAEAVGRKAGRYAAVGVRVWKNRK